MKKIVSLILVVMLGVLLCGCGEGGGSVTSKSTPTFTSDTDKVAYEIAKAVIDKGDENYIGCGDMKIITSDDIANFAESEKTVYIVMVYEYGDSVRGTVYAADFSGTTLLTDPIDMSSNLNSSVIYHPSDKVSQALGIMTTQEIAEKYAFEAACEYLMYYMKSMNYPYSIEVKEAYCTAQASGNQATYYFTVNFSAENALGNRVTQVIGNKEAVIAPAFRIISGKSMFGGVFGWYEENNTNAKNSSKSIKLDAKAIQDYVLDNY